MFLELLFICLVLELLMALLLFKGDILSPAVVFAGVFTVASADLLIMKSFWNVELQFITWLIITLGVLVFIFVAKGFSRVSFKIHSVKTNRTTQVFPHCSKRQLDVCIIIYLYAIIDLVRQVVSSGFLSFNFANYVTMISSDQTINVSLFLTIILALCSTAGYIWCYLFALLWGRFKEINYRLLILIVLSCILSVSNGKRGTLIALLAVLIICAIFFFKQYRTRKANAKLYRRVAVLGIVVVFSFQSIATVMGRDSYLFAPVEYFSIYLGAPILNLDTSIRQGGFQHPVFLSETFSNLYNSLGEKLNIERLCYTTDRIFLTSSNGKNVGNVNTTFYDFYHDAGLLGVVFLTGFMASASQLLYNTARRCKKNQAFFMLLFSYVLWLVARSFFAAAFFGWFTLSTLRTLCIWWFLGRLFTCEKSSG